MIGIETGTVPQVTVRTDDLRELRVFVTVPREAVERLPSASVPLTLTLRDIASKRESARRTNFQKP